MFLVVKKDRDCLLPAIRGRRVSGLVDVASLLLYPDPWTDPTKIDPPTGSTIATIYTVGVFGIQRWGLYLLDLPEGLGS